MFINRLIILKDKQWNYIILILNFSETDNKLFKYFKNEEQKVDN